MNTLLNPEIRDVIEAAPRAPSLSIIQPFGSHISLKNEIKHRLKISADKVKRELKTHQNDEQCELVMRKLQALISGIEVPPNKKGVALFVSPKFEKMLYLDCPVKEKMIVDKSFEIRDLLYNAQQAVKFILLILSGLESKAFVAGNTTLSPLQSNIPSSIYAYMTDTPERISNFSDVGEHKQIVIDKFLRHIDEELGNLINELQLPVVIMGADRILGQFKKLSRNTTHVIAYLEGNYESAPITELTELIQPHILTLQLRRQQELLKLVDQAAGQHLLATGIRQVWHDTFNNKAKVLVVEKNYRFIAQYGAEPDMIDEATMSDTNFSCIKDAVEQVIEKVLANGGDVVFTEDGALEMFGHVVLIKYYE